MEPDLATCPITEGTLLRFLMREGQTASGAVAVLETIRTQRWHQFWPDAIEYDRSQLGGVIGHRQLADAYLVALAKHHDAQMVTLDKGLATVHRDAVHLLGV
ncbi:MAG: VapC toxin family PIN domain ribonuclease [Actinobacteria bacterium]|nr:VapC toxin family PIN domain ribonuclease [Actinomycetota bacterium]